MNIYLDIVHGHKRGKHCSDPYGLAGDTYCHYENCRWYECTWWGHWKWNGQYCCDDSPVIYNEQDDSVSLHASSKCPSGYDYCQIGHKRSDYCYQFIQKRTDFDSAKDSCPAAGTLAMPQNEDDNKCVDTFLQKGNQNNGWIGIINPSSNAPGDPNGYTYLDGQSITFTNGFKNGFPVNSTGFDCVIENRGDGWTNVPCDDLNFFVCQVLPLA